MNASITAIILTFNEEKHIARCINSLKDIAEEIFIVDSFSKDKTIEIARHLGAMVFQNPFVNHAVQFNWALENCPVNSEWVWRIDADEYIQKPESLNLKETLNNLPQTVTGLYVKRKMIFLGKPIMHGGWYPVWHLKLWRNGKAHCENRWKDEHMILTSGTSVKMDCIQVDENLNNLNWWTQKHNAYATLDMVDLLGTKYQIFEENTVLPKYFGTDEQQKRWLKLRYISLPLFIRPGFYFFYCYVIKLGFLDGKSGFVWYVLQSFWYRFLVDAKIFELKSSFKNDQKKIVEYLRKNYQMPKIEPAIPKEKEDKLGTPGP